MQNTEETEIVKQVFRQYRYRLQVVVGGGFRFNKVISTAEGPFKVQFSRIDIGSGNLPLAKVLDMPELFKDQLIPHLMPGGYICFLDEQTTNLNPLDIGGLLATCIERVETVISDWVSRNSQDDIPEEFVNYWSMSDCIQTNIISSTPSVGIFFRRQMLNGNIIEEPVFGSTEASIKDWTEKSFDIKSQVGRESPVYTIELSQKLFVPFSIDWPIDSTKKFFDWLKAIDSQAFGVLINKISDGGTQSLIFIQLNYSNDVVGAYILLNREGYLDFQNVIKKIQRHKKASSRKRKKKSNLLSPKDILPTLIDPKNVAAFTRLIGVKHTESFITSRNTPNESIQDLRIALIGAGTIGGYLAQSLVQVGAGSGSGRLSIYDPDELHSENLGRHILSDNFYLGENKSKAIAHQLSKVFSGARIDTKHSRFSSGDLNKRWDIIIDATGDSRFSLLLSKWYRGSDLKSMLVHGWVTAFGKAVRVLVDDRKYSCYSCVALYNSKIGSERFPLFSKKADLSELSSFHRQCGKSYQAFTSQPGMTAAGLIVRSVLDRHKPGFVRFRQLNLDDCVLETKDQNPKPAKACPVCSKS
ncbi:MAG: ThiF family adenylyltransferase [Saccharospirillum sp.]|uniref:ThiF family adenylyltransferase n=1 Tax=Saccharospirillum sp. TaxID=2033801 RepID=UPI00329738F6